MKNPLLIFSVLVLTLSLSTKTYAQPDSGGFSNGPEAAPVDSGAAHLEFKIAVTNYPNPVVNSTTIRYTVPVGGLTSLKVYNSEGKVVAIIYQGYKTAGTYTTDFNPLGIARGIYVCRLAVRSNKGLQAATRLMNISK